MYQPASLRPNAEAGNGGSSFFGGATNVSRRASTGTGGSAGEDGLTGSGGSGGISSNSATVGSGGSGGDGYIVITEFINF